MELHLVISTPDSVGCSCMVPRLYGFGHVMEMPTAQILVYSLYLSIRMQGIFTSKLPSIYIDNARAWKGIAGFPSAEISARIYGVRFCANLMWLMS